MQRNRLPMPKRATGLLLMIVGFLALFSIPFVFQFGLLGTLTFSWLVALLFCVAVFLLVDLTFRRSVRAILIGSGLVVPSSLIMLIQLPDELQLLLWSLVVSIILLFYRRYYEKHKLEKTSHIEGIEEKKKSEPERVSITIFPQQGLGKPSNLRKAVGILLIAASTFSFLVILPGLAMIDSRHVSVTRLYLPAWLLALVFFVGSSLFSNRRLKTALQAWIGCVFLTFLPLVVLFPLLYEILSICIWVTILVSFLHWYRKKHLAEMRNQAINPT